MFVRLFLLKLLDYLIKILSYFREVCSYEIEDNIAVCNYDFTNFLPYDIVMTSDDSKKFADSNYIKNFKIGKYHYYCLVIGITKYNLQTKKALRVKVARLNLVEPNCPKIEEIDADKLILVYPTLNKISESYISHYQSYLDQFEPIDPVTNTKKTIH